MYLTKKKIDEIKRAIGDFFEKEIQDLLDENCPPWEWTDEEKARFDFFINSSTALENKIMSIISAPGKGTEEKV